MGITQFTKSIKSIRKKLINLRNGLSGARKLSNPGNSAVARSVVILVTCLLLACSVPKQTLTGETMGTTYRVVLRGTDLSPVDSTALRAAIQAELDRLEQIFSTYRKDSEISWLNREYRLRQPYPVSAEMAEVLQLAERVRRASGGAFSPCVGELVDFWGFGATKSNQNLQTGSLPKQLACSAQAELSLSPMPATQNGGAPTQALVVTQGQQAPIECRQLRPKLDLSAIAKGYAVDRLGKLLTEKGFSTYLIEIGGEICVRAPAGGAAWRVGIEDPLGSGALAQAMEIYTGCVATSGNSRQAKTVGSRRVTHIIDPLTGEALERSLSSVSVMAGTAAEADAWATGLFVLGRPRAIELAAAQSMAVMYLEEAAGRVERSTTPAWPQK